MKCFNSFFSSALFENIPNHPNPIQHLPFLLLILHPLLVAYDGIAEGEGNRITITAWFVAVLQFLSDKSHITTMFVFERLDEGCCIQCPDSLFTFPKFINILIVSHYLLWWKIIEGKGTNLYLCLQTFSSHKACGIWNLFFDKQSDLVGFPDD